MSGAERGRILCVRSSDGLSILPRVGGASAKRFERRAFEASRTRKRAVLVIARCSEHDVFRFSVGTGCSQRVLSYASGIDRSAQHAVSLGPRGDVCVASARDHFGEFVSQAAPLRSALTKGGAEIRTKNVRRSTFVRARLLQVRPRGVRAQQLEPTLIGKFQPAVNLEPSHPKPMTMIHRIDRTTLTRERAGSNGQGRARDRKSVV